MSRAANHWLESACARAFWGQQELPPYRQLLADTTTWLEPQAGERWLDLGCGCGKLTQALWEQSRGTLAEIVGLDCAAVNEGAFQKLRETMQPAPAPNCIRFVAANFSAGLSAWGKEQFDGVVSGLAIQYAESFSQETGLWTSDAYDGILAEVNRILRPGGRFIFSVNVSEPSWGRVALSAVSGFFRSRRPVRYLRRAWRMWRYGCWLKREARRGRFHYLPLDTVMRKLLTAGFTCIDYRLSFAKQAYLIRCGKPAPVVMAA